MYHPVSTSASDASRSATLAALPDVGRRLYLDDFELDCVCRVSPCTDHKEKYTRHVAPLGIRGRNQYALIPVFGAGATVNYLVAGTSNQPWTGLK